MQFTEQLWCIFQSKIQSKIYLAYLTHQIPIIKHANILLGLDEKFKLDFKNCGAWMLS